jgi:hypothetical protein
MSASGPSLLTEASLPQALATLFRASRFDELRTGFDRLRMSGILRPFDQLREPRFREQCELHIFQAFSLSKIVILTYLGQHGDAGHFLRNELRPLFAIPIVPYLTVSHPHP